MSNDPKLDASRTPRAKVTAPAVVEMKRRGDPVVVVTAYDHPTARLADEAGVDILLVGDSVGTVMLGYESTLPVTLEDILHHTRAVARARTAALVVADMPFMSYQVSVEQAVRSAGRLIQQGGADAVKLEGGERMAPAIQRLVEIGIPVMGHMGLTPQSVLAFGGYKVQARGEAEQERLLREAQRFEAHRWLSSIASVQQAPLPRRPAGASPTGTACRGRRAWRVGCASWAAS